MTPIMVFLSCTTEEEAEKISNIMLNKKLIACAKRLPMRTICWWKNQKEEANEVLLMMDTIQEKFEEIEANVLKELSSYEQIAMYAIPVMKTAKGVDKWLNESIK